MCCMACFLTKQRHNNEVQIMLGWFHKVFKTKNAVASQDVADSEVTGLKPSPSQTVSPSNAPSCQRLSVLHCALRWSRQYDVFVCHSRELSDSQEAGWLVSFLEAPPRSLRCFLPHRDSCPGSAIPTELCQAVQSSHITVLLVTPHFQKDDWCSYTMHQVLAEGPMSNRIIPLGPKVLHSEWPLELKVYSYIDLNRNKAHCYAQVYRAVLQYLKDCTSRDG